MKNRIARIGIDIVICCALVVCVPISAFATGNGNPPAADPAHSVLADSVFRNVISYFAVAVGIVGFIVAYLQGTLKKMIERRGLEKRNAALQAQIDAAKRSSDDLASPQVQAEPKPDKHLVRIRNDLRAAREKLEDELFKVERRATLNLAIGIAISAAAILILLAQLWDKAPMQTDWPALFATYFPRFIACIFIELLAFFFLRLYRDSLIEMRAYGADLKELTMKQVAVEAIWDQESAETARARIGLELAHYAPARTSVAKTDRTLEADQAMELIQKLAGFLLKKKSDGD